MDFRVSFVTLTGFSIAILCVFILKQTYYLNNQRPAAYQRIRLDNVGKPKLMLDWTGFFGTPMENGHYMSDCPLKNECLLINDKSRWLEADAIVFHGRDLNWNNLPLNRTYNQRYVFFVQESPANAEMVNLGQISNFFNWSMTYRSDSDVRWPYGLVAFDSNKQSDGVYPLSPPIKFLEKKKRLIIWVASNCWTKSQRELIISELKKYTDIDIYGKCGNETGCPFGKQCEEIIDSFYKFYIAFENSVCKDYITEKYWLRWKYNSVPIILRRKTYEDLVPARSFIAVDDFKNVKQLAEYLNYLDKNDTAYMEYFNWRTQGYFQPYWNAFGYRVGFCDLCDKLINDNIPKIYENMQTWFIEQSYCDNGTFAVNWVKN